MDSGGTVADECPLTPLSVDDDAAGEVGAPTAPPPENRWSIPVTQEGLFDVSALQVTPTQKAALAALPQGSKEWLRARWGRLTASNFGAAAGYHLPGAREKLLQAMLWPETHAKLQGFAARAAAHGSANEAVARDLYVAHRRHVARDGLLDVWETGLLVSLAHGWMGASPDFLFTEHQQPAPREPAAAPEGVPCQPRYMIHNRTTCAAVAADFSVAATEPASPVTTMTTTACGEIKCPYTGRLYSESGKHNATGGLPKYYYAQIQALMAQEGLPFCDVVVHVEDRTEVKRFPHNAHFYAEDLLPKVTSFYFEDFAPRLNARLQGRLRRGEVDPVMALVTTPAHALLDGLLDQLLAQAERDTASDTEA